MSSRAAGRGARAEAHVTADRETGHSALRTEQAEASDACPTARHGATRAEMLLTWPTPGLAPAGITYVRRVSDFPQWKGGDQLVTGTFSPAAAPTS